MRSRGVVGVEVALMVVVVAFVLHSRADSISSA